MARVAGVSGGVAKRAVPLLPLSSEGVEVLDLPYDATTPDATPCHTTCHTTCDSGYDSGYGSGYGDCDAFDVSSTALAFVDAEGYSGYYSRGEFVRY